MKMFTIISFIGTLIISVSYAAKYLPPSQCLLKPEVGFCRGAFIRWFFNHETGKCAEFTWGGCGGVVPFETKEQCESLSCPKQPCVLKPDVGPCDALFPRWFYNKEKGTCSRFIWGGCKGNVPFKTYKECKKARCNPACTQKPETGPCKAAITRWFFDNKAGKCKRFTWGGCHGVVPFETLKECEMARCLPLPSLSPSTPSPSPSASPINRCTLKPNPGICFAAIPRYFWNSSKMECQKFIWGGCGGVVPFVTLYDCKKAKCKVEKAKCAVTREDIEAQIPKGGTCQAIWTSWYFDTRSKSCKSISYSGCSPIGPFGSQKECETNCH